jgi:hypothetical protein
MREQCRPIQRDLSDYMDGTLSGKKTVTVAHHLRLCPACQRELESLKRTKALLHDFYLQPDMPDDYEEQFWSELQEVVEERPRSIWWAGFLIPHSGANVSWQTFAWQGQNLLESAADFWHSTVTRPIQWVFRWARFSPLYTFILFVTFGLFAASQFLQLQEEVSRSGFHPIRFNTNIDSEELMLFQRNRGLVNTREKMPGLSQPLSEQFAYRQPVETDIPKEEIPAHLGSETQLFRVVLIESDTSSELLVSAQLSNPQSFLAKEDFAHPLGIVKAPFPEKFERQKRQSAGFINMLMDVPLRILSITEVYDSVKL